MKPNESRRSFFGRRLWTTRWTVTLLAYGNATPSNKVAHALRGIDWFARLSGAVRMRDLQACPVCGTLLPNGSESCPVCALRGALESESMHYWPSLNRVNKQQLMP